MKGVPPIDIGADTIERIRFYRYSSLALITTVLAPLAFGVLLSLVMLVVAIAQGRCWLYEGIRNFNGALAVLATLAVLALFAWATSAHVRSRVCRNLKDFYRETDYDAGEYESFRSALEGVSLGMGMSPPALAVLGIPTVNSIAFRENRRPGIGVTAEALKAGLSLPEKEAMMAHELAHIALGDYFLASSSAGFEYAAHGLGELFLMMAALVAVAVNVYLLAFLLPLAAPLAIVLVDSRLRKKTRLIFRQNDLLADTVAAKLTSDPESLRKAIEKVWSLSETTRAVIPKTAHFQGYLFVTRPLEGGAVKMVTYDGAAASAASGGKKDTTKIYWVPGKSETESHTYYAYDTVIKRVDNLKAIENGHWSELEKPNRREKARNIAGLAAVGLLMLIVVLALLVPWNGKTAWEASTTNVVWKTFGK
jgi:Zn-dependent protease with chaperone function